MRIRAATKTDRPVSTASITTSFKPASRRPELYKSGTATAGGPTPGLGPITADENPQGSKQIQIDGQAFGGIAYELDGADNQDPILGSS